jgi:hypothetical protein
MEEESKKVEIDGEVEAKDSQTIEVNKAIDKVTRLKDANQTMTKDDKIEFESFFANMDKVEEADKVSVFDTNKSDINDTHLLDKNVSNLNNK